MAIWGMAIIDLNYVQHRKFAKFLAKVKVKYVQNNAKISILRFKMVLQRTTFVRFELAMLLAIL